MQNLVITKAFDNSKAFQPLIDRVATLFYQPTIDLIEFEYNADTFDPLLGEPPFKVLYEIYARAGREITEKLPEAWFEKINLDLVEHKFFEFSGYKGDPGKADILQDSKADFCFENFSLFQHEVQQKIHTEEPFIFQSKVVGSDSYFYPSMWGFCFVFFDRGRAVGLAIFADALF